MFLLPASILSSKLNRNKQVRTKHGPKNRKIYLAGKRSLAQSEKQALKNHPRLYLYHHILKSVPKFFNIRQKDYFTQQIKKIFKKNTKDIILEGGWIMK